ncbi:OmpA family protein [Haloferula sp. BvORR071]|uniref:OmpA family protein n=1 Tax=Haloferula sp. BvORR071 TaxID=1396141 RepID=UPI000698781A|nr:OmpA family protein [Haloferula sp. BvORR071]
MKANFHAPFCCRERHLALAALACLVPFTTTLRADPAIREAQPVEDHSQKANPDSKPLEDSARASGKDSRPVTDNAGKAGTDVSKVEDSNANKASPEARKTQDSSVKAGPEAARLKDGNADKANPASRQTNVDDRRKNNSPAPGGFEKPTAEVGSEEAVRQSIDDAANKLRERKLQIQGPIDARAIITEVLDKGSFPSHAEIAREQQARLTGEDIDKREGPRAGSRDDRQAAVEFLKQRLAGDRTATEPENFFYRPAEAAGEGAERLATPKTPNAGFRYLHDGRRYLYYSSQDSVPAVLLAQAKLGALQANPASAVVPVFKSDDAAWSGALLPDEYRGEGSWAISYPVDSDSMLSSHDIVFQEDSTRVADQHGHEVILALAQAITDPGLAGSRFAIEVHSSVKGDFDNNQALSQLRAEAIAREMARLGIAPERLIPAGFGESEATHPEDSTESAMSEDRRVIVYRLGTTKKAE